MTLGIISCNIYGIYFFLNRGEDDRERLESFKSSDQDHHHPRERLGSFEEDKRSRASSSSDKMSTSQPSPSPSYRRRVSSFCSEFSIYLYVLFYVISPRIKNIVKSKIINFRKSKKFREIKVRPTCYLLYVILFSRTNVENLP